LFSACREKAPFTLCVEVLDEAEAAAAVEARAAAAAAAAAAEAAAAASKPAAAVLARSGGSGGSGRYADSAKSILLADQPPPLDDDGAAAAAAEAARSGIPFIANHHRTQSLDTASTSSGGTDAAALAAVQGSSAVSGDAVGAAAPTPRSAAGSPLGSARSVGSLGGEPSFAAMLNGGGSPARGDGGGASPAAAAGSPARPRRLTDDLDAVSDVPSVSEESSSMLGSPPAVAGPADGDGCALLSAAPRSASVVFEPSPLRPQQTAQPPAGRSQLPALALPGGPAGKQPGAGTWIGGGGSPVVGRGGARGGGGMALQERVSSSLETALASLRGEAPLVTVRLEVLNDTPLGSARSVGSGGGADDRPHLSPAAAPAAEGAGLLAAAAAAGAERRRASLDAAAARAQHQCDRSSWACKLGLCKLCNAGLATMGDGDQLSQPRVRVHFVVQGGVGEAAAATAAAARPPLLLLARRPRCRLAARVCRLQLPRGQLTPLGPAAVCLAPPTACCPAVLHGWKATKYHSNVFAQLVAQT
jgi:SWI/SNF-related matrix-associated actin-dependent regulator 1 of chromatin subfamily A